MISKLRSVNAGDNPGLKTNNYSGKLYYTVKEGVVTTR